METPVPYGIYVTLRYTHFLKPIYPIGGCTFSLPPLFLTICMGEPHYLDSMVKYTMPNPLLEQKIEYQA